MPVRSKRTFFFVDSLKIFVLIARRRRRPLRNIDVLKSEQKSTYNLSYGDRRLHSAALRLRATYRRADNCKAALRHANSKCTAESASRRRYDS